MREIKFRAWVEEENEMMSVEEIIFCEVGGVAEINEWWGDNRFILMQCTGLKDKNGVEIYEGDILRWYGYEVKGGKQIRPEKLLVVADYIRDAHKVLCITEGTDQTVEIIGNIYENPELLEAANAD